MIIRHLLFTSLLLLTACHTTKPTKLKPPTIYPVFQTAINSYGIEEYKRPEHFISLPIEIFTWYPKGTTLILPIKNTGTMGALVWRDNCLLFSPYKKDYLVTPIFWANSIVDYKINGNGNDELINHLGNPIYLNEWYYTLSTPIPTQNIDTKEFIGHGNAKCLMDKVIYLNHQIFEPK